MARPQVQGPEIRSIGPRDPKPAGAVFMKIVVCVKQVPDTNVTPPLKPEANWIDLEKVSMVVNPYDEYAVEEALLLIEAAEGEREDHELVLVLVGPKDAEEVLRKALAMGADRAVHVVDPDLGQADGQVLSKVLAEVIAPEEPELVMFGNKAVDDGDAWVGPAVAERLGWPQVTFATGFEITDGALTCHREIEGADVTLEVPLPCCATVQKGEHEPRYPSLPGLMKAKKKEVREVTRDDLDLSEEDLAPTVEVLEINPPPEKKAGVKVDDPPEEAVPQLVKWLREEVQVI